MDFSACTNAQLLSLCIWREARGEPYEAKLGVGCSIRNRVERPSWWGSDWKSVILKPWQYSSFNSNDPNFSKFPEWSDESLWDAVRAATAVLGGVADITGGAVSYFDRSLDQNPPAWSVSLQFRHTVDLGALHFFAQN